MRRAGQITGFDDVTKPYIIKYAGTKVLNSSGTCLSGPFPGMVLIG
jgi:hypothetical protein